MPDHVVKRAYRKILTPSRRQSIHHQITHFRARMGAFWIKPLIASGEWRQYFDLWEKHGFHVTPDHFYYPIPSSKDLPDSLWKKEIGFTGIDPNEATQLDFLQRVFPAYHDEYAAFPHHKTSIPYQYHYDNTAFIGIDAPVLHSMIRHFRPSKVIELGSGFSTLVAAHAAQLNGDTEMVAIEPYPSDILKQGFPGLSKLIQKRAQDIELEYFDQLGPNDILFVDTVHAVKTGGDVNYLFLEVFPRLRPGVIVHIHDIFLPYEYPKVWLRTRKVFWSEQYLLHAFLICNREFEVLFGSHYMTSKFQELARAAFPEVPNSWQGGSFWMRRKLEETNAEDRHN